MCELPEVFDSSDVIARKNKHCCECPSTIFKGEKYQRNKGIWSGELQQYDRCMPCANYCRKLASEDMAGECGGTAFGMMIEEIHNYGILECPREGMPQFVLEQADEQAIEETGNAQEDVWFGALYEYHQILKRTVKQVPPAWELNADSKGTLRYDPWKRYAEDPRPIVPDLLAELSSFCSYVQIESSAN